MRQRFHAEPQVQATELLLQERTPRDVSVAHPRAEEVRTAARIDDLPFPKVRRLHHAHDATPQVHLLSNGRYAVMVTAAGSGYSRWRGPRRHPLARGPDARRHGQLISSCATWKAGGCGPPATSRAAWSPIDYQVDVHRGSRRVRADRARISTTLEIVVSPEDDAEVRQLSLTNTGSRERDIEVTSYCRAGAGAAGGGRGTPGVLEALRADGVRRAARRDPGHAPQRVARTSRDVWAAHQAVIEGEVLGSARDRDRPGPLPRPRTRGARDAIAMLDGRRLSNTVGTVLDPVFALRHRVRVPAGRHGPHRLLDRRRRVPRSRCSTWSTSTTTPTPSCAPARWPGHRRRCSCATWASPRRRPACSSAWRGTCSTRDASLRPSSDAIRRGSGGPAGLWSQGISGDLPIVLLRIDDVDDIAIARQLLQAHEYWRMKQLAVDLVILNERAASYVQDLQVALETLVRTSQSRGQVAPDDARGTRLHPAHGPDPGDDTRRAARSVARVVLVGAARQPRGPARPCTPAGGRRTGARSAPCLDCGSGLGRQAQRRRSSSSSTGSAALRRWHASTSRCSGPGSRRRRRGSTSSPTRPSASRWPPRAAASPGR